MKFGTFLLLQSPDMLPSQEVYARAIEQAEAAEALGFESVWLAEHHFSSYGYCPSPLLLAVKIAERAQRIRVGTAVLVLPLHHPLRIAEDIAMADILTEGRLDVGLGRGYQPYEFARMGKDISENTAIYEESAHIIEKALSGEPFSHQGKAYSFPETSIFPLPIQKPRPPFWVASQQPTSVEDSVRRGYNVITGGAGATVAQIAEFRKFFDQAVDKYKPARPLAFGAQRQVYVTETDAEAQKEVHNSLWHMRVARHLRMGSEHVTAGKAIAEPLENEPTPQQLMKSSVVFGSPETCIQQLRRYQVDAGVEHFNCSFWVGNMTQEQVLRSMELFASQIMPNFKDHSNDPR